MVNKHKVLSGKNLVWPVSSKPVVKLRVLKPASVVFILELEMLVVILV